MSLPTSTSAFKFNPERLLVIWPMGTMELAGSIFCEAGSTGQAVLQIPARNGEPGIFLFDLASDTLTQIDARPSKRINPDFFDQNLACADLLEQL